MVMSYGKELWAENEKKMWKGVSFCSEKISSVDQIFLVSHYQLSSNLSNSTGKTDSQCYCRYNVHVYLFPPVFLLSRNISRQLLSAISVWFIFPGKKITI